MRQRYLFFCIIGFVLPYAALVAWIIEQGSVSNAWLHIVGNRLSLMAWLDVIITALALITFMRIDGRREKLPSITAPILGTCLVGPSFGLPLYLLMREKTRPNAS